MKRQNALLLHIGLNWLYCVVAVIAILFDRMKPYAVRQTTTILTT